jgi:hypothetical protein
VFSEAPDVYPDYEGNQNVETKDFFVTQQDIKAAIRCCPDKCSAGCDGIPNILYKHCIDEIAFPLQIVFAQTIINRQLPREWLISRVSPIFKKGSKLLAENHRPVSITVVACRIFERTIRDHILQSVLSRGLVSRGQHGFLPRRSTLTNLLKFLDAVTAKMNAGVATDAVYLDISKAFDTIPHDKILYKLSALGINEDLFYWIRNFLKGRSQYVGLGSAKSKEVSVTSGVPQGSVLGPLLFLLYFENAGVNGETSLLKFADDSKLFGVNPLELQNDLNFFVETLEELGMSVAISKCYTVSFSCSSVPNPSEYFLHNQVINRVSGTRDIGVFVDQHLKFSEHCQRLASKANSLIFRIFRSFASRDPTFMFSIYTTYVRPILEHNSPAWSPYLKEDIRRIEGPQRRFTKRLQGYEDGWTYLERLHALGAETLLVRRIKADLVLVYKIIHGLVDGLEDLLQFARVTRTRGHAFKIVPQPFNINARKNFFSVRVANFWNNLPSVVVESATLSAFKSNLRHVNYHAVNLEYFD